eukprot:scaffold2720_cov173-Amphora_coffeaeformis.AAC.18
MERKFVPRLRRFHGHCRSQQRNTLRLNDEKAWHGAGWMFGVRVEHHSAENVQCGRRAWTLSRQAVGDHRLHRQAAIGANE